MIAPLGGAVAAKGGLGNLFRIVRQMAWRRIFSAAYGQWLRLKGVRVGRDCRFFGRVVIHGDPRRVTIGDHCSLHGGVTFWTHDYGAGRGAIVLGRQVTCLTGVVFNSMVRIEVGDHAAFGNGCYIQDNDHGTEPGTPIIEQPSFGAPVEIGEDVWLGARTIVLKGVTIGDHAVVGAGSVVVKSLPRDVVAVGVPCRPVKDRGGSQSRAA
jgi:acetyltransferase-like isoleucine patch superfamily enzyme